MTYVNNVFHLSLSESVHSFFMPGLISHWSDKLNSTSSNFNASSPIQQGHISFSDELFSDPNAISSYDVRHLSSPFLTYSYLFLQRSSPSYRGPNCHDAYSNWYIWKYNKCPTMFPTSFKVSSAILLPFGNIFINYLPCYRLCFHNVRPLNKFRVPLYIFLLHQSELRPRQ